MSSPKKIKIVLVGGGSSSGHITPVVAVAAELNKQPVGLLWIGDSFERTRLLASEAQVPYRAIPTGKLHRYFTLENLKTPFLYWAGIRTAVKILREFRPAVVFAKGGSVSLPVVVAAHRLGIPIIIHESDAVMGLANRRAARLAAKICISFPASNYPDLPPEKLVFTGVPVRPEFLRVKANKHSRPQLLVTGGGQGSRAINEVVWAALPDLLASVDVVHLTGADWTADATRYVRNGYRPLGYATAEMAQLVVDADLVVSRASGTTLAEVAVAGKPAILVPLPSAANDHQRANAAVWEGAGAALVIEQAALTPVALVAAVQAIVGNKKRAATMVRAAQSLAQPNAAEKIVTAIESVTRMGARPPTSSGPTSSNNHRRVD